MLEIMNFYIMVLFYSLNCVSSGNLSFYEVIAFNPRERALLYFIYTRDDAVSFLNGVTNQAAMPMDVVVESESVNSFESRLEAHDVQYSHVFNEFSHILNVEDMKRDFKTDNETVFLHSFPDWDSIIAWIHLKLRKHSSVFQKITFGTTSYEQRELFMLKISIKGKIAGVKKPIVFILGGEEGRDWMSPIIILNFINNLLQNQGMEILQNFDFYFIPIFNPDGYSYSMKEDRFWSRNRKRFYQSLICGGNRVAVGVNIDRNWFMSSTKSSSRPLASQCLSIYLGLESLSEEETKAVHNALDWLSVSTIAFINVRSFESLITIPYAYTTTPSNNHDLMMEILSSVTEKLENEYNITYYYGPTSNFFYNFSGNCADWVKKMLNVPVVLTTFMKYSNNFLPDTSEIEPLTQHFGTIINETLLIAGNVYGPLFNNQDQLFHLNKLIITLLTIIVLVA